MPTNPPVSRPSATRSVLLGVLTAVFFLGIPTSILLGVIPFSQKFTALTVGAVVLYVIMLALGYTNADLGIKTENSVKSLRDAAPLTLVLIAAAGVFFFVNGARFQPTETVGFYAFYIFVSSPAQEFLYRGVLKAVATTLAVKQKLEVLLASLLFSFVHIIYRDVLTLVFMFLVGLAWYVIYGKSKNLLGVTLSHAVLGVLTIATGIID